MTRCKHLNGGFSEFGIIENYKLVDNGVLEELGNNNVGNITGYLYVCDDCGRKWKFRAIPKQKFLMKIYKQLYPLGMRDY